VSRFNLFRGVSRRAARGPLRSVAVLTALLVLVVQALAAAAPSPAPEPEAATRRSPVVKPQPLPAPVGDKGSNSPVGALGYGPGDRVADPDEEFVRDSGYPLDYYTFRYDSPILFDLPITRYFGPVDGSGHLLHPENLKTNGGMVDLTLRVWDVDANSSPPGCSPEVDAVSINGFHLGNLTGWDSQWSTVTFQVPVSQLKFPTLVGGQLLPANNTIRVDVDTANSDYCWAVEVDWARLVIEGIRPAVLVHGFLSDAATWSAWTQPGGYAEQVGLPVYAFSFGNNHGSWVQHMFEEAGQINAAKQRFGVDKLHIVGHSKGGIDSRAYLAFMGGDTVRNLVMLGTPNAGSPVADIVKGAGILSPLVGTIATLIGDPALTELTVVYTNTVYNPIVGQNTNTNYYTVAGNWQGLPNGNPLVPGPDDSVVAVSSVQSLPYAASLGQTGNLHTDMTSGAGEWNAAWSVIQASAASGQSLTPVATEPIAAMGGPLAPAGAPVASSVDPLAGLNLSYLGWEAPSTGSTTHNVALEPGAASFIGLLWPGNDTAVTILDPGGQPVPLTPGSSLGLNGAFAQIAVPDPGIYQIIVQHATLAPHLLVVGAPGSPITLAANVASSMVATGTGAVITAALAGPAGITPPVSMTAYVETADAIETVTLVDNGAGVDAVAGDLVFSGTIVPDEAGYYPVVVKSDAPVSRIAFTGFLAVGGDDQLVQLISHAGQDLNGDGTFDVLSADVALETAQAGDFLLAAHLADSNGQTLVQTGNLASLAGGPTHVTLTFDGVTLGESGFSGDLFLHATLLRADGVIADVAAPLAVLSGYDASQFDQAPLRLLPGITDQGVDLNANGRYDELHVTVPVEAQGGTYAFNARLVDPNGQEIGWAGGSSYLNGAGAVTLVFDGLEIGQHGVDGPYQVRDFSLYGLSNPSSLNRVSLHTTQSYLFTQFEGAPVLQDGLIFLPPLNGAQPLLLPAVQKLQIPFIWVQNGVPVLDKSVTIRLRDQNGQLITGFTYGWGISYDPATGEYRQEFWPADYGLEAGDQVQIQVYFGRQLQGAVLVTLT